MNEEQVYTYVTLIDDGYEFVGFGRKIKADDGQFRHSMGIRDHQFHYFVDQPVLAVPAERSHSHLVEQTYMTSISNPLFSVVAAVLLGDDVMPATPIPKRYALEIEKEATHKLDNGCVWVRKDNEWILEN